MINELAAVDARIDLEILITPKLLTFNEICVLHLYYQVGMSSNEIGRALARSAGYVGQMRRSALRKLRRCFEMNELVNLR